MESQSIYLDSKALVNNIHFFQDLAPQSKFMAIVKANAYGHGLKEVVNCIKDQVHYFGVNNLEEAYAVHSINPKAYILIMGLNGIESEEIQHFSREKKFTQKLHFVLSDLASIKTFIEKGPKESSWQLKIDTGLSRLGFSIHELENLCHSLSSTAKKRMSGLLSHFANVEDIAKQDFAIQQLEKFQKASQFLAKNIERRNDFLEHISASAASLLLPESHKDLLRIGISLYGLWPSEETRLSFLAIQKRKAHNSKSSFHRKLKPVLSWKSRIVHIHNIKMGNYVGYGCTYKAPKKMKIGILPTGYYEGYTRSLSNQAYVLVKGKRASILGRVSMNMICIDLTEIHSIETGTEATLLGQDGDEEIHVEYLANLTATINYEFVTRIHPSLRRIVQ